MTRSLAAALQVAESTPGGRLLVRALLALGALEEHPGLLRAVHEIDRAGPAARLATGLTLREVALLVDVLRVLRYVDGDRLAATTLGRAVVALDHHQHEVELGELSSAPPSGLGRLALVPEGSPPAWLRITLATLVCPCGHEQPTGNLPSDHERQPLQTCYECGAVWFTPATADCESNPGTNRAADKVRP